MAEIILREEFRIPDSMEGISKESFWNIIKYRRGSKSLYQHVKRSFEASLFPLTGYDDQRRPDKKIAKPVDVEGMRFLIETRPTGKAPAYGRVVENFRNYLDFLQEQRMEEEALRARVRMIEGEVYVDVSILESKLERDEAEIKEGKDGVAQKTLGIMGPGGKLIEKSPPPRVIRVGVGADYRNLSERSAELYWDTLNFLPEWGRIAGPFMEEVLEDSFRILGEKPTVAKIVRYPFGSVVFDHHIQPRSRIHYKPDVIDSLKKPPPKVLKTTSKVGDFYKALIAATEGVEALRSRGLIDDEFMRDYNPQYLDGRVFVRLEGIRRRLEIYCRGKPFFEQNFEPEGVV